MDLNTVTQFRFARTRADLALAAGETLIGGGTWLFSEPQPECSGVVDLTTMGWPALQVSPSGLRIAATCTIAELVAFASDTTSASDTASTTGADDYDLAALADWQALPLFVQCANALLASWKIWNIATVGGNVCRSFAAASMVSLCVALDAVALIWCPDGSDYEIPVSQLVTGNGTNTLRPAEVLRAIDLPVHALRARTAFRKIALAELGRSGAVLTGRLDTDGAAVFAITAATASPTVLRYPQLPDAATLAAAVAAATGYYTDPLGSADWRRGVSQVLLEEIRAELST